MNINLQNNLNILVTNRQEILDGFLDKPSKYYRVFFINPLGFSKKGIEDQVVTIFEEEIVPDNSKILLDIRPLFFGNRKEIIFKTLVKLFPNNSIVMISKSVL